MRSALQHLPPALLLALALAANATGCSTDSDGDATATQDTGATADAGADVADTVPRTDAEDDTVPPTDSGGVSDADGSDGDAADDAADTQPDTEPDTSPAPNPDCDPIDPSTCALPWPSNLYLAPDATRATGYRLAFGPTTVPSGLQGAHLDPALFARLDGYSVGTPLMTLLPNVDITGLATEDDLSASLLSDAPIVWLKVAADGTTARVPYWVELDSQETDVAAKVLFVRPGVILDEASRYVVAFRGLRDRTGAPLPPSAAFARLRDGGGLESPELAPRVPRFEALFTDLTSAGVARADLQLAWDFVTASSASNHAAMLRMRDDASGVVGPEGPEMTVTELQEYTAEEEPDIAFEVRGTFRVPYYMEDQPISDPSGTVVGQVFHLGEDGLPVQNGFHDAPFWIRVPRSALDGTPQGLLQFGHGLFGSGDEIRYFAHDDISQRHHAIHFATNWLGMSEPDEGRVQFMVFDLNRFRWLSDLTHQGVLDSLLLARAMRERFAALPEIQARGIQVNPEELWYSGNSQGGIYGATYMALSTDVTRGHLGVPGQNYSTLLHRSLDFAQFFVVLQATLRKSVNVGVALAAVQLLWDGVDPVSYYRHIEAEPFAGTPAHRILCAVAKGDYQVAPVTMEIVARTPGFGLSVLSNYDRERTPWGVTEVPYPHAGSGIVLWDFGNPWGPRGNEPPVPTELGDPHDRPRRLATHSDQMMEFLRTGTIVDVCGGDGCHPE